MRQDSPMSSKPRRAFTRRVIRYLGRLPSTLPSSWRAKVTNGAFLEPPQLYCLQAFPSSTDIPIYNALPWFWPVAAGSTRRRAWLRAVAPDSSPAVSGKPSERDYTPKIRKPAASVVVVAPCVFCSCFTGNYGPA